MPAAAGATGPPLGRGIATFVEPGGIVPRVPGPDGTIGDKATVTVGADGKVTVAVGTSGHGQGHETAFAQLAADLLGVPLRRRDGGVRRHGHGAVRLRHVRLRGRWRRAAPRSTTPARRCSTRPAGWTPRCRSPRRRPASAASRRAASSRRAAGDLRLRRVRLRRRRRPGHRRRSRCCGWSRSTTAACWSTRCSWRARCTARSPRASARR